MTIIERSYERIHSENSLSQHQQTLKTYNHVFGIVLILFSVFLWVFSSVLTQWIFRGLDYNHPFFLTYLSTAFFVLYLPYRIIKPHYPNRTEPLTSLESQSSILKLAIPFGFLWYTMNILFNMSLARTSVASNTTISSSSCIFTLIISAIIIREKINLSNCMGVILTASGGAIIGWSDSNSNVGQSLSGDLLALLSASLYGVYTTFLKYKLKSDDYDTISFYGYIGFSNSLILLPVMLLLDWFSLEKWMWPSGKIISLISLNAICSIISDVMWARAILITSPLIASCGMTLTIPLALFSDIILHHKWFKFLYLLGACLVLIGFVIVNWQMKSQDSNNESLDSNNESLNIIENEYDTNNSDSPNIA